MTQILKEANLLILELKHGPKSREILFLLQHILLHKGMKKMLLLFDHIFFTGITFSSQRSHFSCSEQEQSITWIGDLQQERKREAVYNSHPYCHCVHNIRSFVNCNSSEDQGLEISYSGER